jgi:hypothetical protein
VDRDEALRLLRGGEDGVREWNQRRRQGEEIPDLLRADLRGAKDLTQAQIEWAQGDVHTELPEGMVRPANWVDLPRSPLLLPQADNH